MKIENKNVEIKIQTGNKVGNNDKRTHIEKIPLCKTYHIQIVVIVFGFFCSCWTCFFFSVLVNFEKPTFTELIQLNHTTFAVFLVSHTIKNCKNDWFISATIHCYHHFWTFTFVVLIHFVILKVYTVHCTICTLNRCIEYFLFLNSLHSRARCLRFFSIPFVLCCCCSCCFVPI